MMKATLQDKATVVSVLSASFFGNKSVGYIVGHRPDPSPRIRKLMEYSFFSCLEFGEVWLSECRSCCALVLLPEKKQVSLPSVFRDAKLALSVIGIPALLKVMRREGVIHACYRRNGIPAKDSFDAQKGYYLWFIGTDPVVQGKGRGSRMLRFLIDRAENMSRSVYLETSVEKNLAWYNRFGFQVYDQLDFGFPLYFLRK